MKMNSYEPPSTEKRLPVRKPYICEKEPHQCIPPVLDTDDEMVLRTFYEMRLKPLGWWSWEEYSRWLNELRNL